MKSHFIVKQGIVLGHIILNKYIEVDKVNINLIVKYPPSTNVNKIKSFLAYACFYMRFIKDFSNICHPLCNLLGTDVPLCLVRIV